MSSALADSAPRGTRKTNEESKGNYRRTYADFQALDRALVDSDLAATRRAFAQLQKDSPGLAELLRSPATATDSPRRVYFRMLADAVAIGDMGQAQEAFTWLQQVAADITYPPFAASGPLDSPAVDLSPLASLE